MLVNGKAHQQIDYYPNYQNVDLLKILNNYHSVALRMLTRTNNSEGNHATFQLPMAMLKKSHKHVTQRNAFRESTERHTFG